MRLFHFITPRFRVWPLAVAREIRRRDPGSRFSAIVTGSKTVFEDVVTRGEGLLDRLDHLDPLERRWLETPYAPERLDHYDRRLGPGRVRRIVVADRQLGHSTVTGARIPRTRLMELADDTEAIRRYVVGLLDFVFDLFERDRPDVVFSYTVAGAVAMAVAEATRVMGIRFALLTHTRVGDRHVLDTSPEGLLAPVRELLALAQEQPERLAHRMEEAARYLKEFRAQPRAPGYTGWVIAQRARQLSWRSIIQEASMELRAASKDGFRDRVKYLRVLTPRRRGLHQLRSRISARRLATAGPFLERGVRPDRSYAYFPLHTDPEQATMVMAPMHTDQLSVIEALAKSLPLGMDLLVKEHSPMLGLRPAGFYERIARLPGVSLASPFEDGLVLVGKSSFTCVITGTAGWEALLLGVPVLVVGNAAYLALGEGAVQCTDLSSLPRAVDETLRIPPAGEDALTLYLAAILESSFEVPTELFWGNVTPQLASDHPEIAERLAEALISTSRATS